MGTEIGLFAIALWIGSIVGFYLGQRMSAASRDVRNARKRLVTGTPRVMHPDGTETGPTPPTVRRKPPPTGVAKLG